MKVWSIGEGAQSSLGYCWSSAVGLNRRRIRIRALSRLSLEGYPAWSIFSAHSVQEHTNSMPRATFKMDCNAQTSMACMSLISLIVHDYDDAIIFFTEKLGFHLPEDSPATSTITGAPKRWVVIHPPNTPGSGTGILLAQADSEEQKAIIGKQWAGRVGLFMHVEDFEVQYHRMKKAGVEFLEEPRDEKYGRVVVFRDICGNKWDLLGSSKQSRHAV